MFLEMARVITHQVRGCCRFGGPKIERYCHIFRSNTVVAITRDFSNVGLKSYIILLKIFF